MSFSHIHKKVRSTNRFFSGVSTLTLSAMVVKVIGLLYKIPLLRCLGTEGMGYFNTAYELYALFCVISTAGLPVAMSMLISRSDAQGDERAVRRIYRTALFAFVVMGAVGSLLLFGFAEPLSLYLKNPAAASCLRFISPTVFLICLSSAQRGFFQGKGNMLPTAVSQVVEALGKLILGLLFAVTAMRNGCTVPMTAAFAVLGLTVGTGVSALYLTVRKWYGHRNCSNEANHASDGQGGSTVWRQLMATAVPVTISAGIMSVTKLIDVALILRRLQDVGYGVSEANSMYGCYSTLVIPVFNILPSLTTSVAMSAVPSLSAALQRPRKEASQEIHRIGVSAMRLVLWISVPAAMGLAVYGGDVLSLLFSGENAAVAQATPWLRILALSVPSACLMTVCSAMLQVAGHARTPIYAMIVGVAAKVLCAYYLLGRPDMGLLGAPVSSLLCDTIVVIIELYCLGKWLPDVRLRLGEGVRLFLLPVIVSAASLGLVSCALGYLPQGDAWGTLLKIGGVAVLYGAMMGAVCLLKPLRHRVS